MKTLLNLYILIGSISLIASPLVPCFKDQSYLEQDLNSVETSFLEKIGVDATKSISPRSSLMISHMSKFVLDQEETNSCSAHAIAKEIYNASWERREADHLPLMPSPWYIYEIASLIKYGEDRSATIDQTAKSFDFDNIPGLSPKYILYHFSKLSPAYLKDYPIARYFQEQGSEYREIQTSSIYIQSYASIKASPNKAYFLSFPFFKRVIDAKRSLVASVNIDTFSQLKTTERSTIFYPKDKVAKNGHALNLIGYQLLKDPSIFACDSPQPLLVFSDHRDDAKVVKFPYYLIQDQFNEIYEILELSNQTVNELEIYNFTPTSEMMSKQKDGKDADS